MNRLGTISNFIAKRLGFYLLEPIVRNRTLLGEAGDFRKASGARAMDAAINNRKSCGPDVVASRLNYYRRRPLPGERGLRSGGVSADLV
jgi:hypothetical protein